MSYPYTYSAKNFKSFLTEISSRGIPDKIDEKYLESVGYAKAVDKRMIPVLKFIKVINKDGTLNENYVNFRDVSKSKYLMASLVKNAYADLFTDFPDADRRDNKTLINWFKTKMGVNERTATYTASTFKVLCSFADFVPAEEKEVAVDEEKEPVTEEAILEKAKLLMKREEITPGLIINVNIQLALPATENVDVYDKIFKSLKENILARSN
jgi:hypothetical protein